MTIAQIQHFLAILEWGGFSAAASETFISQSSLSKQIKKLENELNTQLFNRANNKISLTPAGEVFLKHARIMDESYKKMLQDIACYQNASGKKLISLGVLPLEQQYRLLERVTAFQTVVRNIQVNITEDNQEKLLRLLDSRKLDLAVLRTDYLDEEIYQFSPVYKDSMVLVCSRQQAEQFRSGRVSLDMVADLPFVLLNQESAIYSLCREQFDKARLQPKIVSTASRHLYLLNMVKLGLGVTILPRCLVNNDTFPSLCCLELEEPIESIIGIVCLRNEPISNSAERLYRFFAEQAPVSDDVPQN